MSAELGGADLRGATINGADFSNADVDSAYLSELKGEAASNLKKARNLTKSIRN